MVVRAIDITHACAMLAFELWGPFIAVHSTSGSFAKKIERRRKPTVLPAQHELGKARDVIARECSIPPIAQHVTQKVGDTSNALVQRKRAVRDAREQSGAVFARAHSARSRARPALEDVCQGRDVAPGRGDGTGVGRDPRTPACSPSSVSAVKVALYNAAATAAAAAVVVGGGGGSAAAAAAAATSMLWSNCNANDTTARDRGHQAGQPLAGNSAKVCKPFLT